MPKTKDKDPLLKAGYKKEELPTEKQAKRRGIVSYRMVRPKPGVLIRVAITKKKGPRGGRTVATSKLEKKRR